MGFAARICAVPRKFTEVGELVRSLRVERNLDQRELAKLAKLPRAETISQVENGSNSTMETYDLIARGLGFSNALLMFSSGGNRATAKMLRLWKAQTNDQVQKDALKLLRDALDHDEG